MGDAGIPVVFWRDWLRRARIDPSVFVVPDALYSANCDILERGRVCKGELLEIDPFRVVAKSGYDVPALIQLDS